MLNFKLLCIRIINFITLLGALLFSFAASAQEVWTLENSIKHAINISPVIKASDAEIDIKKGELAQAGAWPNPSIGLSGNNKLGLEDKSGKKELTQLSVSQSIPLGRLSTQRLQAKAELDASRYDRYYEQLSQELATSRHFHRLQLTASKLNIAKEQLQFASRYKENKTENDALVRYLTPLEIKRLNIINETAIQKMVTSEGEYKEALSSFKEFMNLPSSSSPKAVEIKPTAKPIALEKLLNIQETNHAAIEAMKHKKEAAKASIAVAQRKRFEDPTLTFSRERDIIDGRRQYFNGLMLSVTVPLLDFKNGDISKAKAEAKKVEYQLQELKRNLQTKLYQSHLHLEHLIVQAERYRTNILVPAKEVFELTKKGFSAGELNVLSLIDASDTYFDARNSYLELIYESLVEAAELRLATGVSLLGNDINANNKTGAK